MISARQLEEPFQKDTYHNTFDYPVLAKEGEGNCRWGAGVGVYDGFGGYTEKPYINVGPSCFGGNFTYKIEGNNLKLYDPEGTLEHVGYKCDYGCCEKQKEFFLDINVEIDLATLKDTSKSVLQLEQLSLITNFYLGESLTSISDISTNSDRLSTGFKFITIEEISLALEKQKVKIPENKRDRQSIAIYPNSNSNLVLLSQLLAKLSELGFSKVHIAMRDDSDLLKEIKVRYLEVETNTTIERAAERTIGEWLISL